MIGRMRGQGLFPDLIGWPVNRRNWLSLRNNGLKFKTAGKLPIVLEELIEYTPIH